MDRRADLETLFAPVSAGRFLAEHWQRRPLLSPGDDPDRFAGLVRLDDVDFLVTTLSSLEGGWIMLSKDGVPRPNYTVRGPEQLADLAAVHAAYDDGYTIILTMLQRRWPAVGRLCRDLEGDLTQRGVLLARRVAANLYLTPPGSRGFDPHYDEHDVVVLQLEGEKLWRVHGSDQPRPIERQRQRSAQLPALEFAATLRPGQALYIPRGCYHEAATSAVHSLHLTLSVPVCTWIDLITRMLPLHGELREALPLVENGGSDGAIQGSFEPLVRSFLERGDATQAAQELADEWLRGLDPLPDRGLRQRAALEALTMDSHVRRSAGAIGRIRRDGARVSLLFPGSGVRGPAELTSLFRFVLAHETFQVADLPGDVASEDKIEFARQLVREGFLRVDEGGGG